MMLVRRLMALALIGCAWISAGCASHAPMSELVMFEGGRAAALHPAGASVGFSAQVALTRADDLQRRVEKERVEDGSGFAEALNPDRRGIGGYVAMSAGDIPVAASGSLGRGVAGVDLTAAVAGGVHVTLAASAFGGVEVVVQRPVLDLPNVGVALGLGYRRETHVYSVCPSTYEGACGGPIPNVETAQLDILGWRAVVVGRQTDRGLGLYGSATVGYAPAFDRSAVSASISLVAF